MSVTRRTFLGTSLATGAVLAAGRAGAASDRAAIYKQIEQRHDEAVQRLQDVDTPAVDRRRESRCDGRLRPDDAHAARGRLSAGRAAADRWSARHLRNARRRRAAHVRVVFHVRREAGRSAGVVVAAVGSAARRSAEPRQGRDGPRCREPEGPAVRVARGVACDPRGGQEDPGEPRARRGRRGGDRLAAFPAGRARFAGARGAREVRGHLHARGCAGSGRQRDGLARCQGHRRAGAGRERREVGARSREGRALQQSRAPR